MNSPTPWASEGGGFSPRMPSNNINLSDGGIIAPIKAQKQKKLADGGITGLISRFLPPPLGPMLNMMINPGGAMGGIGKAMGGIGGAVSSGFQMLTNPTKLIGEGMKAVLPMNRNVGKDLFGGGDKRKTENITKVLTDLPQMFAGGALAGFIGMVARSSPILGLMLNAAKPVIKPLLDAIGLPASVLGAIFGGSPASAATMPTSVDDGGDDGDGGGDGGDGGGGGGGAPADPNLSGTSVIGEVSGGSLVQRLGAGQRGLGGAVGHADVGTTTLFGPSSYHGRHHNGIDIGTSNKTGYMAAFRRSGKVTHAGPADGYGNLVIIKDDETGTEYYFGHLKSINPDIKVGSAYNGQTIGEIGKTGGGLTNGEHLHFEKRPPGSSGVDPMSDLPLIDIGKKTRPLQAPATAARPAARPSGGAASGGGARSSGQGGGRAGGRSPGGVRTSSASSGSSASETVAYSPSPSSNEFSTYYGSGFPA
jgi:hypothetical protein